MVIKPVHTDAGDTRGGDAASAPAGVKAEDSTAVKEEAKPRLTGQKRVKAEDESDGSDERPAKTAKKEEEPTEAPTKPVAVPRASLSRHSCPYEYKRWRCSLRHCDTRSLGFLAVYVANKQPVEADRLTVTARLKRCKKTRMLGRRSLHRASARSSRRSRARTDAQLRPPLRPPAPQDRSRSVSPAST